MTNRADTTLLYGETGTGKTVQLGEIAKWHYDKTGEVTRLISADSGWDPIEHLITAGIIEAWNIQYLRNPFPVLIKLSEGYWPSIDPLTKKLRMAQPGDLDPLTGRYCTKNGKVVGQYAIEGLSTISDMLLQDHIRNLRKISEEIIGDFSVAVDIVDAAGKPSTVIEKFGKAGRSQYGHIQEFVLLDLVPRFGTLPVERVFWTAHEARGDDDITGVKGAVLGPATAGKAATSKTAKKFGDTFHVQKVATQVLNATTKKTVTEIERRAYYEDHPDDTLKTMLWPAKLSFPIERIPELRRLFPGNFVPLTLTTGLVQYLEFKSQPWTSSEVKK